jgi:hypothetical protein
VKNLVQRKDMREHGQEPRYSVQIRPELDRLEVVGQFAVSERDQVTEHGQVLLDHSRVVLEKGELF